MLVGGGGKVLGDTVASGQPFLGPSAMRLAVAAARLDEGEGLASC
eukprot:SAG25_NODE_505_length_7318_cov_6.778917_9_plen_45_part_00